jgi:hypothetical protein
LRRTPFTVYVILELLSHKSTSTPHRFEYGLTPAALIHTDIVNAGAREHNAIITPVAGAVPGVSRASISLIFPDQSYSFWQPLNAGKPFPGAGQIRQIGVNSCHDCWF